MTTNPPARDPEDAAHFGEDFALVIPVGYPDGAFEGTTEEYSREYLGDIQKVIADATDSDDVLASQTSYGYGADTLAVVITLGGLSALLLSGKRINDNLNAWLALGRRLVRLSYSVAKRFGTPRFSEPAALAIALADVSRKEVDMPAVALISKVTTKVTNSTLHPGVFDLFRHHPDRYYVFTIKVAERSAHVVGVASTGDILFHHSLNLDFHKFPLER